MPYRGKTGITDNVEIEAPKGTGGIEAVSLREHSRTERELSPTIPVLSANAITKRAQANPRPNAWLAYDIGVVGGWNLLLRCSARRPMCNMPKKIAAIEDSV